MKNWDKIPSKRKLKSGFGTEEFHSNENDFWKYQIAKLSKLHACAQPRRLTVDILESSILVLNDGSQNTIQNTIQYNTYLVAYQIS